MLQPSTMVHELVCRLESADGKRVLGTACIVSSSYALTAFHCVGDRATGEYKDERVQLNHGPDVVSAHVESANAQSDFALLKLEQPVSSEQLPLGVVSRPFPGWPFKSIGWSKTSTSRHRPAALAGGTIGDIHEGPSHERALAVHLRETESAKISGGPLLLAGYRRGQVLTGVARWGDPFLENHPATLACPIDEVIENTVDFLHVVNGRDVSIYLSYVGENAQLGERVREILTEQGLETHARIDAANRPGLVFESWLRMMLDRPDTFVLVLCSTEYELTSDPLSKEEQKVLRDIHGRPSEHPPTYLPIRLMPEAIVPDYLEWVPPLDLFGNDGATGDMPSHASRLRHRISELIWEGPDGTGRFVPIDLKATLLPSEDFGAFGANGGIPARSYDAQSMRRRES